MIKLGINIDHIATIRQQRKEGVPSLVQAALICEEAGADGITVHLREDRRHIQDQDIFDLMGALKTRLNLEMAPSEEILDIALKAKPASVCLVPEKRQELTTEGGLDVAGQKRKLARMTEAFKKEGIKVSVFIEPEFSQVEACAEIGAYSIEIHTGKYANLFRNFGESSHQFKEELGKILNASNRAIAKGLILNAGHGLDCANVKKIAQIPQMNEFNIGFSVVARAVFVGLEQAVREMKSLLL